MNSIKIFLNVTRPKTLIASILPVAIGSSIAYNFDKFNWYIFCLTFFSALFIQIGTNIVNDLHDYIKGADNENRIGPKRATQ